MPKAARLGDICTGHDCFPPSPIISGSSDVFINGKPAARLNDPLAPHVCPCDKKPHALHPPKVAAGSSTVFINGFAAARVGDAVGCGGSIAAGSGDVLIGDDNYINPCKGCAEAAEQNGSAFVKVGCLPQPRWIGLSHLSCELAQLDGLKLKVTGKDSGKVVEGVVQGGRLLIDQLEDLLVDIELPDGALDNIEDAKLDG